jgi:hypothetical protein
MKRAPCVRAAAAADVAAHAFAYLIGAERGAGAQVIGDVAGNVVAHFLQHRHRRADLPGGAVAALVAIVFDERSLHRVQFVRGAQPFDGGDLRARVHHRQGQAGIDAAAVHQHRAGTALAVVAAFLGAGQVQVLAQCIQQGDAGVQLQRARLAVDLEGHLGGHRCACAGGVSLGFCDHGGDDHAGGRAGAEFQHVAAGKGKLGGRAHGVAPRWLLQPGSRDRYDDDGSGVVGMR